MSRYRYHDMIAEAGYNFLWDCLNSGNIQPLKHEIRDMIIGADLERTKIFAKQSSHLWSWER